MNVYGVFINKQNKVKKKKIGAKYCLPLHNFKPRDYACKGILQKANTLHFVHIFLVAREECTICCATLHIIYYI